MNSEAYPHVTSALHVRSNSTVGKEFNLFKFIYVTPCVVNKK